MKTLSVAIVIGAALIAGALSLSSRYTLVRGNELALWRVDQFTGKTSFCLITAGRRVCSSVPDAPTARFVPD